MHSTQNASVDTSEEMTSFWAPQNKMRHPANQSKMTDRRDSNHAPQDLANFVRRHTPSKNVTKIHPQRSD